MISVPLCLTCLDRNFDPGFFTTLGLFLWNFPGIFWSRISQVNQLKKREVIVVVTPEVLGGSARRTTRNVPVKERRKGEMLALLALEKLMTLQPNVLVVNHKFFAQLMNGLWERIWVFRPNKCTLSSSIVFSSFQRWWYSQASNWAVNFSASNKLVIKRYLICASGRS